MVPKVDWNFANILQHATLPQPKINGFNDCKFFSAAFFSCLQIITPQEDIFYSHAKDERLQDMLAFVQL